MYKKSINYTGFDGNEETLVAYFNINQMEATRLNARYDGDITKFIEKIIESKDISRMLDFLEDMILSAYGKRSEDGLRFVKNAEVRENFSQTLAYEALFSELLNNPDSVSEFVDKTIVKNQKGQNENLINIVK